MGSVLIGRLIVIIHVTLQGGMKSKESRRSIMSSFKVHCDNYDSGPLKGK